MGQYFSSPIDISPVQQWTPPTIQEIREDVYGATRGDVVLKPSSFSPTMEGTSAVMDSRSSTSSQSDSSGDYEAVVKSHSSYCNFSGRGCFMSKAVYPLSFPLEMPTREASGITTSERSEYDSTPRRDRHHLSSATVSVDLTGLSEHFDDDLFNRSYSPSDQIRCGLCERFLSQRSPWSSRRIVRSGDMPVAGILSCRHVFHAECLEYTTPKVHKSDPPCPICVKVEEENSPDPRIISKLTSRLPRFKPMREDGPSKPWGCTRAGDCVERALHIPTRNTVLSLNRTRFRKKFIHEGKSKSREVES
ncbi:uncharacterized protein LOC111398902 isoform X1 [Olea europaea var. sylvestris]|uniref:RING U-box superfamily, isoform 1 n=1 Tax=Olea europaea subsp. europaea TaxID=158383 RepID=A0A8S0P6H2_OLEEU|nr:uncharacterized protein LOC111398902 isoform X1 [Olea europaea var. sylvestris]XP_022881829.1 uncharacterized protein LOC111398902 isoform X1 [Olea europaea var. sylvestris]XP_022881830.1 uncharacterized protein LOC111398902 isoform X1 [Olea europaea var. sylvestris]XP_022881831.1 uncharacterized protein LOC111398902 isoform X1 [Olea europaea var. sylvestris]CAA2933653.1 RING U-box superfamily, isoform 1 [Olea europaea subsp. europaea]